MPKSPVCCVAAALAVCLLAMAITTRLTQHSRISAPFDESLDLGEYDFVVVGGGSAGSIVAALLSDNPAWRILLLEAGGGTQDGALSEQTVPGLAADNIAHLESSSLGWGFQVESQETKLEGDAAPGFTERRYPIPRGKVLGGSNELNFMLHVRGTAGDYEVWHNATGGDARWSPEAMARLEHEYETVVPRHSRGSLYGGSDSPHDLATTWVEASAQSPHGFTADYNAPFTATNSFDEGGKEGTRRGGGRSGGHYFQHAVANGQRASTARRYLLPRLDHANLRVVLHARATRVLLTSPRTQGGQHDNEAAPMRATGVEFTSPGVDGAAVLRRVRARKEVILCAGAYGSPHLLLLSGIGNKTALRAVGVDPLVDLPGVGQHLQDHQIAGIKYRLGGGSSWWPYSLTKMTALLDAPSLLAYATRGTGVLSSSGIEFGYFGASNDTYRGRPDLQIHGMPGAGDRAFYSGFLGYKDWPEHHGDSSDYSPLFAQGIILGPTLLHPEAVGSVSLRSKDPMADPKIRFEAFGKADDLRRMIRAIRVAQEIMAQPAMQALEPELLFHRKLAADFGADTDKYWSEYLKRFGFVVYHPTGTCRMGRAEEPGSVVDADLRVLGLSGLRVADASIMPEITSGNTQVPTSAIGLQLVHMLRREYANQ